MLAQESKALWRNISICEKERREKKVKIAHKRIKKECKSSHRLEMKTIKNNEIYCRERCSSLLSMFLIIFENVTNF